MASKMGNRISAGRFLRQSQERGIMRYRIYLENTDTGVKSVREIEAPGEIVRVCDDHGRVVYGKSWPKKDYIVFPKPGREEPYYN